MVHNKFQKSEEASNEPSPTSGKNARPRLLPIPMTFRVHRAYNMQPEDEKLIDEPLSTN